MPLEDRELRRARTGIARYLFNRAYDELPQSLKGIVDRQLSKGGMLSTLQVQRAGVNTSAGGPDEQYPPSPIVTARLEWDPVRRRAVYAVPPPTEFGKEAVSPGARREAGTVANQIYNLVSGRLDAKWAREFYFGTESVAIAGVRSAAEQRRLVAPAEGPPGRMSAADIRVYIRQVEEALSELGSPAAGTPWNIRHVEGQPYGYPHGQRGGVTGGLLREIQRHLRLFDPMTDPFRNPYAQYAPLTISPTEAQLEQVTTAFIDQRAAQLGRSPPIREIVAFRKEYRARFQRGGRDMIRVTPDVMQRSLRRVLEQYGGKELLELRNLVEVINQRAPFSTLGPQDMERLRAVSSQVAFLVQQAIPTQSAGTLAAQAVDPYTGQRIDLSRLLPEVTLDVHGNVVYGRHEMPGGESGTPVTRRATAEEMARSPRTLYQWLEEERWLSAESARADLLFSSGRVGSIYSEEFGRYIGVPVEELEDEDVYGRPNVHEPYVSPRHYYTKGAASWRTTAQQLSEFTLAETQRLNELVWSGPPDQTGRATMSREREAWWGRGTYMERAFAAYEAGELSAEALFGVYARIERKALEAVNPYLTFDLGSLEVQNRLSRFAKAKQFLEDKAAETVVSRAGGTFLKYPALRRLVGTFGLEGRDPEWQEEPELREYMDAITEYRSDLRASEYGLAAEMLDELSAQQIEMADIAKYGTKAIEYYQAALGGRFKVSPIAQMQGNEAAARQAAIDIRRARIEESARAELRRQVQSDERIRNIQRRVRQLEVMGGYTAVGQGEMLRARFLTQDPSTPTGRGYLIHQWLQKELTRKGGIGQEQAPDVDWEQRLSGSEARMGVIIRDYIEQTIAHREAERYSYTDPATGQRVWTSRALPEGQRTEFQYPVWGEIRGVGIRGAVDIANLQQNVVRLVTSSSPQAIQEQRVRGWIYRELLSQMAKAEGKTLRPEDIQVKLHAYTPEQRREIERLTEQIAGFRPPGEGVSPEDVMMATEGHVQAQQRLQEIISQIIETEVSQPVMGGTRAGARVARSHAFLSTKGVELRAIAGQLATNERVREMVLGLPFGQRLKALDLMYQEESRRAAGMIGTASQAYATEEEFEAMRAAAGAAGGGSRGGGGGAGGGGGGGDDPDDFLNRFFRSLGQYFDDFLDRFGSEIRSSFSGGGEGAEADQVRSLMQRWPTRQAVYDVWADFAQGPMSDIQTPRGAVKALNIGQALTPEAVYSHIKGPAGGLVDARHLSQAMLGSIDPSWVQSMARGPQATALSYMAEADPARRAGLERRFEFDRAYAKALIGGAEETLSVHRGMRADLAPQQAALGTALEMYRGFERRIEAQTQQEVAGLTGAPREAAINRGAQSLESMRAHRLALEQAYEGFKGASTEEQRIGIDIRQAKAFLREGVTKLPTLEEAPYQFEASAELAQRWMEKNMVEPQFGTPLTMEARRGTQVKIMELSENLQRLKDFGERLPVKELRELKQSIAESIPVIKEEVAGRKLAVTAHEQDADATEKHGKKLLQLASEREGFAKVGRELGAAALAREDYAEADVLRGVVAAREDEAERLRIAAQRHTGMAAQFDWAQQGVRQQESIVNQLQQQAAGLGVPVGGGGGRRGGGGRTWYDRWFGEDMGQLFWTMFMGRRIGQYTFGTMGQAVNQYAAQQQAIQAAEWVPGAQLTGAPAQLLSFQAGGREARSIFGRQVWDMISPLIPQSGAQNLMPGLASGLGSVAAPLLSGLGGIGLYQIGLKGLDWLMGPESALVQNLGLGGMARGLGMGAGGASGLLGLGGVGVSSLLMERRATSWLQNMGVSSSVAGSIAGGFPQSGMAWGGLAGLRLAGAAGERIFGPGEPGSLQARVLDFYKSMDDTSGGREYEQYRQLLPQWDTSQIASAQAAFVQTTGVSRDRLRDINSREAQLFLQMANRSMVLGESPSSLMQQAASYARAAGVSTTSGAGLDLMTRLAGMSPAAQQEFMALRQPMTQAQLWMPSFTPQQMGAVAGYYQTQVGAGMMTTPQAQRQIQRAFGLTEYDMSNRLVRLNQQAYRQAGFANYAAMGRSYGTIETLTGLPMGTTQGMAITPELAQMAGGVYGGAQAGDYVPSEWAIQQRQIGAQRSYQESQMDIREAQNQRQYRYTTNMMDINRRQREAVRTQEDRQFRWSLDAMTRQQTARDLSYQQSWRNIGLQELHAMQDIGLAREGTQLNYQQSLEGIGLSERGAALSYQHGLANLGRAGGNIQARLQMQLQERALQWQMRQLQTQWQREEFGIAEQRMPITRGWERQDWLFQRETAGLQFGWQTEDVDRAIRFASGREKAQLIRQRERMGVMYGREEQQRIRGRDRMEQAWEWEDEDFDRKKSHFEEITRLQDDLWKMQTAHMIESANMQMGDIEAQRKQLEENYKLQQDSYDLQRRHLLEDLELREKGYTQSEKQLREGTDEQRRQLQDTKELQDDAARAEYRELMLSKEARMELRGLEDEQIAAQEEYTKANLEDTQELDKLARAYWEDSIDIENDRLNLSNLQALAMGDMKLTFLGEDGILGSVEKLGDHAARLAAIIGSVNWSGWQIPPDEPPAPPPTDTETVELGPREDEIREGGVTAQSASTSVTVINLMLPDGEVLARAIVPTAAFRTGISNVAYLDEWRSNANRAGNLKL